MAKCTIVAASLVLCALLCLPAAAADLNQAGMAAYRRGDFEQAEQLFRRAIAESPREPLFHYHRAAALTHLGRWTEATQEYETVLRLGPDPTLAESARTGLATVRSLTRPAAVRRPDREETSVPLSRSHGGWIADVVLNDERKARFLVDTGASISVLSPELAKTLRVEVDPTAQTVKLSTLGGVISAPVTTIPSINVGGVEASGIKAVVYEVGPNIDGILGNTFLDRYQITVDAARSRLLIRPR